MNNLCHIRESHSPDSLPCNFIHQTDLFLLSTGWHGYFNHPVYSSDKQGCLTVLYMLPPVDKMASNSTALIIINYLYLPVCTGILTFNSPMVDG